MQFAANTFVACGGGIAVAQDGKLLSVADFPSAGTLPPGSPGDVASESTAVREAAQV